MRRLPEAIIIFHRIDIPSALPGLAANALELKLGDYERLMEQERLALRLVANGMASPLVSMSCKLKWNRYCRQSG